MRTHSNEFTKTKVEINKTFTNGICYEPNSIMIITKNNSNTWCLVRRLRIALVFLGRRSSGKYFLFLYTSLSADFCFCDITVNTCAIDNLTTLLHQTHISIQKHYYLSLIKTRSLRRIFTKGFNTRRTTHAKKPKGVQQINFITNGFVKK